VVLGQSSLARPGQLLQAPPTTGLAAGGQRRGGKKVKSSWEKAECERKETAGWQDNCGVPVQLPALPEDAHYAERNTAQEPPAQPWRVQIPVQHLCARGGNAGG